MMRAKRTDANQVQIVDTFRKLGFSVFVTSAVGNGFPDIVVGKAGRNFLIEIKDGSKAKSAQKLTPKEAEFFREWKGHVELMNSVDDVIRFVDLVEFFNKVQNYGLPRNRE